MNTHPSNNQGLAFIPPLAMAKKFATAHFEPEAPFARQLKAIPRLAELIRFIQWLAMQPGGLDGFIEKFIDAHEGEFRTSSTPEQPPKGNRYNLDTCLRILAEFPRAFRPKIKLTNWELSERIQTGSRDVTAKDFSDKDALELVEEMSYPSELADRCWAAAEQELSGLLRRLCTEPGVVIPDEPPAHPVAPVIKRAVLPPIWEVNLPEKLDVPANWFCPRLLPLLIDWMDRHAEEKRQGLALTEVVKKVFHALHYIYATRGFSEINGNSRFGKSEAARLWCEMYPGRGRYFSVPSAKGMKALLRAMAEPYGYQYDFGTTAEHLSDEMSYIIRWSGLLVCADEVQFLLPPVFNKNTQPERLNWFRTEVVDRDIPTAVIQIPKTIQRDLKRFSDKTGYANDQWAGRPTWPVTLPETLSKDDMLAVVWHHLPGLDANTALTVAGRAMAAPGFLKAVENVATRAGYLADGKEPPLDLVLRALDELLPPTAKPSAHTKAEVTGKPTQPTPPGTRTKPVARQARLLGRVPANRLSSAIDLHSETPRDAGAALVIA